MGTAREAARRPTKRRASRGDSDNGNYTHALVLSRRRPCHLRLSASGAERNGRSDVVSFFCLLECKEDKAKRSREP